ncbi:MAG: hypothetical protein WA975_03560 [Mesorhizobium sp.]
MIAVFALMALLAYDGPRIRPDIPRIPVPWCEQGNRHARRREAKMGRGRR